MREKLIALISDLCMGEFDTNSIGENTDLIDDLGFDSISLVELSVELEGELGIDMSEDALDIEKLRSMKFLFSLVE